MRWQAGMLTLTLLGLAAGAAHGQTRLAWRFEQGEKFWIESVVSTRDVLKATTGIRDEAKEDAEFTTLTSFVVKRKLDDGSVVLEQKIESMKVGFKGALGKPDAIPYKLLEGATFLLTFSPQMELKAFEGYDALLQRVAVADKDAATLFRQYLSEDMLKRSVEEAFGFLPDKEVKPGQKWSRKLVLSLGELGQMSGLNGFTYRGYLDGKERIDVESTLSYVPPPANNEFVFQVTKSALTAETVKGTIYFNPQAGKLSQSDVKLRVKGSLVVQVMGQLRNIEVDQERTIRTRLLNKPPGKQ